MRNWRLVMLLTAVGTHALAEDCIPSCRSGFVCVRAQCVSACNPPCEAGLECRSDGECVSPRAAEPAVTSPVAPPPSVEAASEPSVQTGFALNASIDTGVPIGLHAQKVDVVSASRQHTARPL